MSKKSSKKSSKKKRIFLNNKNVQWFGIDIHHIALGISLVGCVIAFLLIQKQKSFQEESRVLAAQTGSGVAYVRVGGSLNCENGNCVNISPVPRTTCIPRPPCLDATPHCTLPEPIGGWCSTNSSPTPELTPPPPPQGCYYKKICPFAIPCDSTSCKNSCRNFLICPSITPKVSPPQGCHLSTCPTNQQNCTQQGGPGGCFACDPIMVCPSGTPQPYPTCLPRPWCLDHTPRCMIPEPKGGWCPPTVTPQPSCGIVPTCDSRLGIPCKLPCRITPMPHPTCTAQPSCTPGKFCPQVMIGCTPVITLPVVTGTVSANNNSIKSFFTMFSFLGKFFSF